ncbi:MAG: alpha/beta fold hydrolase [Candidatus Andeanibacterium colombiense]|uniref:Alpha/beta fold hydrolase n=1 Tax=Candidatus Andeanibacterium colombiense TaxID=3121345 RepID=A0AAJ5X4U7_9SPHN|nr:MAG: alpha/beta fold hydrolase [Sphingomonadaceae bacterium]
MGQAIQHLILVPGSLCDERVWQNQARDLADVAQITVPHLHGHDSLVSMAEAILANAPERFALAGFSMGGRVALEMLRRAPERITRLALVDSSIHPIAEGEAERREPQIDMTYQEGMAAFADWWNPRIVHASRRDDAEYMGLLRSMAESFTPAEYEQEVRALLNRPDPRDVLAMIAVPTLVLFGDEDMLSTPDRNRSIAAAIPGARLVPVEGTGHFPMLEKPDEVTAALREWLLLPLTGEG